MGTPVSKAEESTSSQEVNSRNDSRRVSEVRSPTPNDEEVSTQMLCADDEDPLDDDELVDMYTSLTSSNVENDSVMNTKFDRTSLPSLPSIGAIVDKELYSPNGRICSANGRVTARFISAEMLSADNKLKAIDASKEDLDMVDQELETETQDSDYDVNSPRSIINRTIDETEELSDGMSDPENEYETHEAGDNVSESPEFKEDGELSISAVEGNDAFSPTPRSNDSDTISDPSDGNILRVPRKRFNSAGVESIISGIEPLNDTNHIFYEEVKQYMAQQGFFDKFPSPAVIEEAQDIYKKLGMSVPTDEEGNLVPHPANTPVHDDMMHIQSGKVFDTIEKMPTNLQTSGKSSEIAQYLCKGITDEAIKIYTIMTYMVCQQLETCNDQDRITEPSLKLCKMIRTFCKFCKLKSTIIRGILRDSNCVSNEEEYWIQKFWMAVLVKKSWVLIDPVISPIGATNDNNENLSKEISREYVSKCVERLFQEPTQFVFSHYPDEEIWQLLARPVLREELHDVVLTRSGFFKYEMELLTHSVYDIHSCNSEIVISLGYATDKILQFKCSFRICDSSLTSDETRKFVFLENVILESKVYLRVRFPKKGSYFLELFAESFEESLSGIVAYRVTYEGDDIAESFPNNPREEWGPGMAARSLGLEAVMYHSGEIITRKGVLQIAFKDRNYLHYEFYVHPVDIISGDYLKVSFLKDRKNNVIFVVEIDAKINGTFVLQLMARKPDTSQDFRNFCNYFIRKEKSTIIPMLKFDSVESLAPKEILPANKDGTLQLTVDLTKFIHVTTSLLLLGKQEIDCSEHVRVWIEKRKSMKAMNEDTKQAHMYLNFPRSGKYRFVVRGQKTLDGYNVIIRDEMIQADIPSEQWSSFPKLMTWWDLFYKIEAPLTHILREKELITVSVHLFGAQDVAIVGPGGWNHLKMADTKNVWIGQVWTGPKSTRIRLQARFEIGSDRWSELLWYKVIAFEDYQRFDENQKLMIEKSKNRNSIDTIDDGE